MKTFSQINEFVCPPQKIPFTEKMLKELEASLARIWKHLNVEVDLGTENGHFFQRLNDERNGKQISFCEVQKIFVEVFKKYGSMIAKKHPNFQAVMTDLSTSVNIPFILKMDYKNNELEIVPKTAMRKTQFHTPDPKLAVENRENKMSKQKTFRDLKEWVGFNTPEIAPIASPQAVDDVDNGAHYVEDPINLDKLNAYCHDIANNQYINPYYPLNALWKKLNMIGINFDLKAVTLMGDQGRVTVPLTQFGGRYGVLGHDAEHITSDDGISHRIPGGLELAVYFQKQSGIYTLDAQIGRADDGLGFMEATDFDVQDGQSVTEADIHPSHAEGHNLLTKYGYKKEGKQFGKEGGFTGHNYVHPETKNKVEYSKGPTHIPYWHNHKEKDGGVGIHGLKKHLESKHGHDTMGFKEDVNEDLVPGHKLPDHLKKHVLSAYVHRHTHEHPATHMKDHKPSQSDHEWLGSHAFHVTKKGQLSNRDRYAHPHSEPEKKK